MQAPELSFSEDFISIVNRLQGSEVKRVWESVDRFKSDPNHSSLNFHPVEGDGSGRLHTFRASQELRVLLAKEGNVYVLLEAGHHDPIYERAGRIRFIANPTSGFVGPIDLAADEGWHTTAVHESTTADDVPGIFDHWGDSDLRDAGFDDAAIKSLRSCIREDDLPTLDLHEDDLLRAIDLIELTPEQWRTPALDPHAEAESRLRDVISSFGALAGISPLFSADEVAKLAAAPIEEWMIFLHPDQRAIVDRHVEGPARVRGAAGTGKTVVALHRAVSLSKRFEAAPSEDGVDTILFTTYIRSLSPVLKNLHERLPGAQPERVDFVHIDSLAYRICVESNDRPTISPKDVDAAFASAEKKIVSPGSAIDRAGLSRGYLRDEINAIIKGRGIRSIDEYLGVERTGRRTRFPDAIRHHVWELKEEWDAQLASRGIVDFPDVMLRARDHARRRSTPMYRAALIDEAQDLTLVGLQLVRTLVNGPKGGDRPDGLFLVGDGAQRIYPGAFTLRQAGVEVRGRTTVLKTNYRNTAEILESAMAVAGNDTVDDLGDVFIRKEGDAEPLRQGVKPVLIRCEGADDELRFIAERINDLVASGALGMGDVALLAPTNKAAKSWFGRLTQLAIPCLDLTIYDGTPSAKVKVGTYNRAKGLEFKVVFLPGLNDGEVPTPIYRGQDPQEYEDQRSVAVSRLFVAMTRARDGLFLTCSTDPCDLLIGALDSFEVIDS